MLDKTPVPSEEIYLLADHLDAALAAGEDLIAASAIPEGYEDEAAATTRFVRRVRMLEAALVSRILQARKRAQAARNADGDMRSLLSLFVANSAGVLDLIDTIGRRSREVFETGDDPMSFLRTRGLIADDVAMPESLEKLQVGDDYKIGGVVQLGPLLDLVSTMLETLDIRYDLYAEDAPDPVLPGAQALSLHDALSLARTAAPEIPTPTPTPALGAHAILAADVAAALADVREETESAALIDAKAEVEADVEIDVPEDGVAVIEPAADAEASAIDAAEADAVVIGAAEENATADGGTEAAIAIEAEAEVERASEDTDGEADEADKSDEPSLVTPASLLAALEAVSEAAEKQDAPGASA